MQGILNTRDIKYYSIAVLTGSFSLFPFAALFINKYPLILKSTNSVFTTYWYVFIVIALLLGLLFLEFAGWVEDKFDNMLSTKQKTFFLDEDAHTKFHNINWYNYLIKSKKINIVILYIVFRLKFELALIFSLFIFKIGIIILNCSEHYLSSIELISIIFIIGILIYNLLRRAWLNCISLSYLRYRYNVHFDEINNNINNNI
jgi:hypothetical protein